ncbi:MAG: hypothetical protein ACOYOL_09340, partial [Chthoniobacterales bacterium]
MIRSATTPDLSAEGASADQQTVEIAHTESHGSTLRNIARQPWFNSLLLFAADLALVSGAYLTSRTVRVDQALNMSAGYFLQVGVFFFCILLAVALIGGYKARRTFR